MSRSHFRNMLALLGCYLFLHLINVVVGVPYEGISVFCEVNGKFYREGEQFASTNPGLMCQCQRGYTGRNVEPFCRPIRRPVDRPTERPTERPIEYPTRRPVENPTTRPVEHPTRSPIEDDKNNPQSLENCVPITTNNESPKYTHYTEQYRCPNDEALIPISMTENLRHTRDEQLKCTFGNKKLGIGDFFYHSMINDTRNCVRCICERPPKPTCVRPPTCPLVHVA